MEHLPTITTFGSCRVVTPSQILHNKRMIILNQQNIFGFVHNALEMPQQFRLICGGLKAPTRLRDFLNIPDHWKTPATIDPAIVQEKFHEKFASTDVFIIEVSSIRVLQFKSMFLQIHRTREILTGSDITNAWWQKLVRTGQNDVDMVREAISDPRHREIVENLTSYEQSTLELIRSLARIKEFLKKPVLFVSTFNTDYHGKPVAQRTVLVEAMKHIATRRRGCGFFDPTKPVIDGGLTEVIQDLGHYRPDFEPVIADLIYRKATALLENEHSSDDAA